MKKFSPEKKLEIYQAFLSSRNKAAVARTYNIDRSYLYDIVENCNKVLMEYLQQQKAGRKEADAPETYKEALEKIKTLEAENLQLEKEKEEWYIRSEFLELRLGWAEENETNRQLKKSKRKKP